MATCETTDFVYPLLADIYYPIVEQGAYGNVKKQWVLDRTIACFFNPASRKFKQDVVINTSITIDNSLVGRVRTDITENKGNELYSITNIIITNIRDKNGDIIYTESSGIRKGQPTIFEISTSNPIVGAFGKTEYYKLVITRSDNQAVDL
jgi:hypothetical protein